MNRNQSSSDKTVAVIDIGSSAIRLLVACKEASEWTLLDKAEQPLALGSDVFQNGRIARRTMNRAAEILNGFKELMQPYGVDRVVAIGTSALRESSNREMFIDRMMLQTEIEIRVIEGIEANQLTWLAVQAPLEEVLQKNHRYNVLIIEVGAGNTDLIVLQNGKISKTFALPIGTLRLLQKFNQQFGGGVKNVGEFMKSQAMLAVKSISYELGLSRISKLVAVGSDARKITAQIGKPVTSEIKTIPRTAFQDSLKEITPVHTDFSWNESELFYPALVIFDSFVQATKADEILVPSVSIRQGLLINYAAGKRTLHKLFAKQVLSGSRSLAKQYRTDTKHGEFVRRQAVVLYNELTSDHGLKGHHRLLLESAAILHDIGAFIGATGHHKHSLYIIRHSDIFGLSASEKEIVGHVTRYHRRAKPQDSHSLYMNLNRNNRVVVQKLAALLRLANTLDRSHTQKIKISRLEIVDNRMVIYTSYPGNLSMEKLSLDERGDLFKDVFGLHPILRFDEGGMGT